MIYTSNYDNAKSGNLISISEDGGKGKNFEGKVCSSLAPKLLFWNVWHDNIGKIDPEMNRQFYMNQYYYQVLRKVNFNNLLSNLGNDTILLCYEEPNEFCHRFLLASYLEIKYGISVPELLIDENGNYISTTYKPYYLKDKMLRLVQIHER